tara:strand:+ start:1920 stop:2555 length:636 start_codon:yes stop_codon:yes gene_type:complete
MPDSNDLAKLTQLHYLIDKHGKKKATKKINKKLDGTGYTVSKLKRGVANYKHEDGHNVISVKGTDVKQKKDLISDIKLGLGFSNSDKQFKQRRNDIKNIIKTNDGDNYLTGHSLGASISTSAMVKSKSIRDNIKKADVFNTGYTKSFHDEMSSGLKKSDKKELKNKLTHHRTKGDLISNALASNNIGEVKTYKQESKTNPLANHSLESIIQ